MDEGNDLAREFSCSRQQETGLFIELCGEIFDYIVSKSQQTWNPVDFIGNLPMIAEYANEVQLKIISTVLRDIMVHGRMIAERRHIFN